VAAIDLDTRSERSAAISTIAPRRRGGPGRLADAGLPTFDPGQDASIDDVIERIGRDAEIIVIDTPGRDDPHSARRWCAPTHCDADQRQLRRSRLIGEVDAETYRVRRPSFYAELVWNSVPARQDPWRQRRLVVLRNRMQHIEARNMRRVGDALAELSRRVGFRIIRALASASSIASFSQGLTLLDLREIEDAAISHIAARQELREMIAGFALPEPGGESAAARPAAMAL